MSATLTTTTGEPGCFRVGVLGLGIIGTIWAGHYAAAGVLAGTWNRTAQPTAPGWRDTPEAVVVAADVVHIVLADPPAVRGVLERIRPALGPGKIVVQSSTIDPASSEEFRALVTATGARYLEAPFTGSKPAAEQRQTVFYLGGEAELQATLEPTLALVSAVRLPIGDHRQAAALKLAMNLNLAVQMQGLLEARALAAAAGIGDEVFYGALARNVGYSGLVKLKEPKLRAGDFSPQFSVKHLHKDMRLASGAAGCAELPALDAVRVQLKTAEARGYGDEDFIALAKVLGA
ncbi:MAG: NAD(P)-binding domain-containing protein [Verrucomicrobia bacterium]|nr:NAD(P)-binding domain-containing protein [Verrucomicrobiota bacterium]